MAKSADLKLSVRVSPRGGRCEIGGVRAGQVVVRTTAAPVDGRANAQREAKKNH